MPHLLAAILTQVSGGDELGELRMRLSAGGFRDCTRVAGGLSSMWREIIYGNRRNVIEGLTRIEAEIQRVKEVLSQDDEVKNWNPIWNAVVTYALSCRI